MNRHYTNNPTGKDFIVGDLHGCRDLFDAKLEEIGFDKEKDRMFSVGDLIDRGPDSMRCLALLKERWFHPVIGNHERFLIDGALYYQDLHTWDYNGGLWRWTANEEDMIFYAALAEKTMPLSITVDTPNGLVGICHAEPPSDNWDDVYEPNYRQAMQMVWGRTKITTKNTSFTDRIHKTYHGHSIVNEVTTLGNAVFIDTGAVFTKNLTMIRID